RWSTPASRCTSSPGHWPCAVRRRSQPSCSSTVRIAGSSRTSPCATSDSRSRTSSTSATASTSRSAGGTCPTSTFWKKLGTAKLGTAKLSPGMIATREEIELPAGLRTVDEALHRTRFRILPFLGPAFIACVAYIDPGNFATNISGGSKFGYRLVWVIVLANLVAMLIQTPSAKLGIAKGRNLPEVSSILLPRRVSFGLWVQAEAVAIATDLAEFLGAAIGIDLLAGLGLFP